MLSYSPALFKMHPISTEVLTQVKAAGAWIWSLTPSTAVVKNEWNYASAPPTRLHGVGSDNSAFLNLLRSLSAS